jgi:shikimate dehydrogenase
LYDLIYNPELTTFLNEGRKYGAKIKNGLEMLYLQAEATWGIWSTALGKS